MEKLIEVIRGNLDLIGELTALLLNVVSLVCILMGVILSFSKSIGKNRKRLAAQHPLHTFFRMHFGGWLIVALEFQLAADIVASMVSPTTTHLIQLGAIALIRTFLNYFLNKELLEERANSRTVKEKSGAEPPEVLRAT